MLNSKKHIVLSLLSVLSLTASARQNIYHKGWIDFNKNGKMDVYENLSAPIMERVSDLLAQMTTEEKTCQLATLYGSKRVLKDWEPTAAWKNCVWKDGIANIDEQANGIGRVGSRRPRGKTVSGRTELPISTNRRTASAAAEASIPFPTRKA